MGERVYAWKSNRRFNASSDYFRREFGRRMQKVSVNAGFTCPNRDGTVGTGGCSYCNNMAFSPSYCIAGKPIRQQVEEGILFHRKRYRRAERFIAYFQSYTNTYAGVGELRKAFLEALSVPGISGIIAGTRPDCINDDILDFLQELSEKYYMAVEYGIESCYNRTLKEINRGHNFEVSASAVRRTSARGIKTGGHIIFGLPGETREEMLNEAAILSNLPLDSLKFHQLQIVKGTFFGERYLEDPESFILFNLDEYLDFMVEFIELLNPLIAVDRFSGEVPLRYLVSNTRWGVRSDQVTLLLEKKLEERDSWQGKRYGFIN